MYSTVHRNSYSQPRPATEKQLAFIRTLAAERGVTLTEDDLQLTVPQASAAIETLLAMPKAQAQPPEEGFDVVVTVGGPKVEPLDMPEPLFGQNGLDLRHLHSGRYAATLDGVTKFFHIDVVTEGKWSGWVFVRLQASDDLYRQGHQKPGQTYRGSSQGYLELILKDPRAASELYGREIGACGVCGRTLTDEASRARGIGPVCAEKMGW